MDVKTHENIMETSVHVILTIIAFSSMLPYDQLYKKIGFSFGFSLVRILCEVNPLCPETPKFLMKLITFQIYLIALSLKTHSLLKLLLKHSGINEHAINFTITIFIVTISSLLGLLFSISKNYHLQLFSSYLPSMLLLVFIGFAFVFLFDYSYTKIKGNMVDESTRRKIFHFVPLLLLPLLSQMDYRVFLVMALGSYYLFWIMEIGRYFGGLAKDEFIRNHGGNQMVTLHRCLGQCNGNIFEKIVGGFNYLNLKILDLPLIKWMQGLNGERQKYFWFTHLSLILGLSLTYVNFYNNPILRHMSLIFITSDAAAAIIGKKYGKNPKYLKLPSKKTIQGFCAYILTAFLLQTLIFSYENIINSQNPSENSFENSTPPPLNLTQISIVSVLCALVQLFSGDLDNISMSFAFVAFSQIKGIL